MEHCDKLHCLFVLLLRFYGYLIFLVHPKNIKSPLIPTEIHHLFLLTKL